MNKTLQKIITILMIIIFPLGIIYCIIHALGKDFSSFIGVLCMCGIGILIGIYIIKPEIIIGWITLAVEWIKNIKIA